MKKLPEHPALFWLTKIVATTLGKTAGDLFSMTLNIGYVQSSLIFMVFFLIITAVQLFSKRYIPMVYLFVILATSTVGITMFDYMDRTLGLDYANGSLILATILLTILFIWKIAQKPLSVTAIKNRKEVLFIG